MRIGEAGSSNVSPATEYQVKLSKHQDKQQESVVNKLIQGVADASGKGSKVNLTA